jgi:hypothetical protein
LEGGADKYTPAVNWSVYLNWKKDMWSIAHKKGKTIRSCLLRTHHTEDEWLAWLEFNSDHIAIIN